MVEYQANGGDISDKGASKQNGGHRDWPTFKVRSEESSRRQTGKPSTLASQISRLKKEGHLVIVMEPVVRVGVVLDTPFFLGLSPLRRPPLDRVE